MMIKILKNSNSLLWLFAVAALLLSGCAADKAYDEGSRLLEHGNYNSAIAKLKESIRLAEGDRFIDNFHLPCCGTLNNPEKIPVHKKNTMPWEKSNTLSKYRLKLKEAKRRAAVYHYQQAHNALNRKDLAIAKSNIDKALVYDQARYEYHDLLKVIVASRGKAETLRKQALEYADQQDWPNAVKTMQQALAEFRSMPNGKHTLDKIKRDAYDYHYELAKGFLNKDDRDDASAQANKALEYLPKGSSAKNILTTVANRNKADNLVLSGEKMMQANKPQQALDLFQRAYKLYPGMPKIVTRITNARKAVCDQIIAAGNMYMESGRYANALRSYRRSRSMLKRYGGINELIEKVSVLLADAHNKEAVEYSKKQLYGNALFYDVLNLGYVPANHTAKQRLFESKKVIEKDIKYVMGFVGIKSSQNDRNLASYLEAEAVQHLNNSKPANVLFMERMDLNKVIEEQNFNLTDMVDPDFKVERGKLKGVDALVVGQILENKVLSTSKTSYGKTEYQDGDKLVPNPEYPNVQREYEYALSRLSRARQEVREARSKLRRTMDYMNRNPETYSEATIHDRRRRVEKAQRHFDYTQQKADLAQQQLNSTPQQRSVPNILPHSYPIQHVTRTARISLFIKVLDTMTGSIIFTDRITGSYTQSDKHVEGDSFRNVIADPLDLPDNPAMSDKAMHKTIKDMRRSLSVATKKHGQRFVTKMRRAEKIGDSEQAVENCIRYLFAYPVGSDYTNKMISYLESLIPTEKDLVNLNSMLQKQCSVLLRRAQFPASLIDRKNRVMITRLFARMPGHIKMPCTLVAIDGTPVKSIKQVDAIMTQYAVGDRVAVTVASNNKNFSAEIELSKAH